MKYPFKLALGLTLTLAACGSSETSTSSAVQLGPNPVLAGGSYSAGGGITIAAELREIGGMTGICGAWAESDVQGVYTKGRASGVMQSASIYLGGRKLKQDLLFMRKIAPVADYAGAEANCITVRRPWQPGDEARRPTIRIPKQLVYQQRTGGAVQITFTQTGPGASNRSRANYGIDLTDTESIPLSHNATLSGGRYSSGGGITIAGAYQEIKGITYACGIWSESKDQAPQTAGKAAQVLASGSILLNGRVVVKDLRFMQETKPGKILRRKIARCTSTGLPWVPGYANQPLAVSIPRQIVSQDQGQVIYFEPTGPGA
jgi:hypothetical protein